MDHKSLNSLHRGICIIAATALLTIVSGSSAGGKEDQPALTIPRLQQAPKIENFLRMQPAGQIESQMIKVSGFIQQEPKDGAPSSERTEVYLGYDDDNLYAVFLAFDSEPDKVRARLARREEVAADDIVEIMLDTFHDRRRAYTFVTNPLGIQWDGLWTEGNGFDGSFDTLWHSRGKLTEHGYVVFMTIPFKSLRFSSSPEQEWGVIFLREIRRGNSEQSFWPRVSSRIEGRLNQAATLKIQSDITPGRNMQFIPYATYRTFRLLNPDVPQFKTKHLDPDAGLDAKFVLNDNFALDATVNPDFNQVESDQPQITANQRFEVFFPEKRPFFLENANFFQSPFNLVFTRRIAEPQFGARLTGKAGAYAIGALLSDDEAPGKRAALGQSGHGDRAAFGILRVSRDILDQSNIGLTYTDREFAGGHNRVGGFDGRLKLTPNWDSTVHAVWSQTKTPEGETLSDPAFSLTLNRGGRKLTTHYHYRAVGRDFRTDAGFVPRADIHDLHFVHSYNFRPEGKFLTSWGPDILVQRIWDQNNLRLDDMFEGNITFNLTGQTEFQLSYDRAREKLRPADFSVLQKNIDFATYNWGVDFETNFVDEFRVEAEINSGTAINFSPLDGQQPHLANLLEGEVELNLRPSTKFRIDNNYIFFQLNDRNTGRRIFRNQILRSRWNWQFNRKLSLRLILQYDLTKVDSTLTSLEREKNLNLDFLFTYLVNPWTALYAGVNSNYQNLDLIKNGNVSNLIRTRNHLLNDGRQFFVKYSYLFRL